MDILPFVFEFSYLLFSDSKDYIKSSCGGGSEGCRMEMKDSLIEWQPCANSVLGTTQLSWLKTSLWTK